MQILCGDFDFLFAVLCNFIFRSKIGAPRPAVVATSATAGATEESADQIVAETKEEEMEVVEESGEPMD